MIILLRLAFAVAGIVVIWITLSVMARLSWQVNGLIALAGALAFAFYFEREERPR